MKSKKYSNKGSARFFESESKDDYPEPLHYEDQNKWLSEIKEELDSALKAQKEAQEPKPIEQPKKLKKNPKDKALVNTVQINSESKISQEYMKICIESLGEEAFDAKDCYEGLHEFKELNNDERSLGVFKEIYSRLFTMPRLFLSLKYGEDEKDNEDKIKSVLIWQLNKYCPVRQNEILTDVRCNLEVKVTSSPSLLLLAKIVPNKNEEIIEARLLEDCKLLVKSKEIQHEGKISSRQIYRIYYIKSFYDTYWVNPMQHKAIANHCYTWKIDIDQKRLENEETNWGINFWKKKAIEEVELSALESANEDGQKTLVFASLDELICKRNFAKKLENFNEEFFSEIVEDSKKSIVFYDKETSSLLFVNYRFLAFRYLESVQSYNYLKGIFYFINKQGKIYQFSLSSSDSKMIRLGYSFPVEVLESESFEWKVYAKSKNHSIFYYYQNTFHEIPINLEEMDSRVLCSLNTEKEIKTISWDFIEHSEEFLLLSYLLDDKVYIHDIKNKREFKTKFLFINDQKTRKWKIETKVPRIIAIYDNYIGSQDVYVFMIKYDKNLLEVKNTEDFKPLIEVYQGEKAEDYLMNDKIVQLGNLNGEILFIKMKEPVYEDKFTLKFKVQNHLSTKSIINSNSKKSLIQEEQKASQNIKGQEESDSEVEPEKVEKVKKNIKKSKNFKELNQAMQEAVSELKTKVSQQVKKAKEKEEVESRIYGSYYDPNYWKTEKEFNNEKRQKLTGVESEEVDMLNEIKHEKKKMKKILLKEMDKEKRKKGRKTGNDYDDD